MAGSDRPYPPALLGLKSADAIAIAALYYAVPSFSEVESEYWDETVIGLPYSMLGNLVQYVHEQIDRGYLDGLQMFFDEVERLLRDGDLGVRDLIVVEVLEELIGLSQVIPYLGPNTRRDWNALLPFFHGERAPELS